MLPSWLEAWLWHDNLDTEKKSSAAIFFPVYASPFLGCEDPRPSHDCLAPRWRALFKGVIVTHVGLSLLPLIQGREVIVGLLSFRLEGDVSSGNTGPHWPVSLPRQRLSFAGSRYL